MNTPKHWPHLRIRYHYPGRRSRGFWCLGPHDCSNQSTKHHIWAKTCNENKIWIDLMLWTRNTVTQNIDNQNGWFSISPEVRSRGFRCPGPLDCTKVRNNKNFMIISLTQKKSGWIPCVYVGDRWGAKNQITFWRPGHRLRPPSLTRIWPELENRWFTWLFHAAWSGNTVM